MKIVMDGKTVERWGAAEERKLTLARDSDAVEGIILSADQVAAAAERMRRILYSVLILVVAVVFTAAGFGVESGDLWVILPVMALLALSLAAFMTFMFRRQMAKARLQVAEIGRAYAAPPGSAVRANAQGLTLASHSMPWPTLSIANVDIENLSIGEDGNMRVIQRLSLVSGRSSITLFANGMKNGRAIIDKVWRELRKAQASDQTLVG
jgi:hypothetical protein